MKNILLATLFLLITISSVNAQDWITDFENAKALATKENKTIILVFQGSDWCAPCIKLDKEVWSTEEFQSYAKDNFVMLQADFPKRKKNALSEQQQAHNNNLAEIFNKNGYFPYVVVLDSDGNELGAIGYKKTTPSAYIKTLESFKK